MNQPIYPQMSKQHSETREALARETLSAWRGFSNRVFADGVLPAKTKQLIAVAVAHVTQCPYCIRSHTSQALKTGANPSEIMEAIWIAAEMRAGAAVAHSTLALDVMKNEQDKIVSPKE